MWPIFAKAAEIMAYLKEHWTAARAARLDADISSRAPASTALSRDVWTNTRAGYIDLLPDTKNAAESAGMGDPTKWEPFAVMGYDVALSPNQTLTLFSGTGRFLVDELYGMIGGFETSGEWIVTVDGAVAFRCGISQSGAFGFCTSDRIFMDTNNKFRALLASVSSAAAHSELLGGNVQGWPCLVSTAAFSFPPSPLVAQQSLLIQVKNNTASNKSLTYRLALRSGV